MVHMHSPLQRCLSGTVFGEAIGVDGSTANGGVGATGRRINQESLHIVCERESCIMHVIHIHTCKHTFTHTSKHMQTYTFLVPLWLLKYFFGQEDGKEIVRALHPNKHYPAS